MKDLLARLQNNDEKAFKEAFYTYKAPIYYFIVKIVHNYTDAEDLMMITFEKAFAGVKYFIPNYKFVTWLYEIARNTSIDYLRVKKTKPSLDGELNIKIKSPVLNPEQELIIKDHVKIIEKGIRELTQPNFREIMSMYQDGFKMKEICRELNIPIGTVLTYILRAKKELKKLIA